MKARKDWNGRRDKGGLYQLYIMPSTTAVLLAAMFKHRVLSLLQILRQVTKSSASARLLFVIRGEARARAFSMLRAMIRVWVYIVGVEEIEHVWLLPDDT